MLAGFDGTLTLLLVVVATMTLGVDWRLAGVVLLSGPAGQPTKQRASADAGLGYGVGAQR